MELPDRYDRSVRLVDAVLEETFQSHPRDYLGASIIGHPCARRLWYEHRGIGDRRFKASSIRAIEDGHRGEAVMAARLKAVKRFNLHTGPAPGVQYEVEDSARHVIGHPDGIITGLVEAPEKKHVWEHKVTNEKKWSKLHRLRDDVGEKYALERWDIIYYGQAQTYMLLTGIDRHFLTCSTPGERQTISVRTELKKRTAKNLLKRAKVVAELNTPPARINDSPAWYECKMCNAYAVCHQKQLPEATCRTCEHARPDLNTGGWYCWLDGDRGHLIPREVLMEGCKLHLFKPELVTWAEKIGEDRMTNTVSYRTPGGETFTNGPAEAGHVASRYLQGMVPGLVKDEGLAAFQSAFPGSRMEPHPVDTPSQNVDSRQPANGAGSNLEVRSGEEAQAKQEDAG